MFENLGRPVGGPEPEDENCGSVENDASVVLPSLQSRWQEDTSGAQGDETELDGLVFLSLVDADPTPATNLDQRRLVGTPGRERGREKRVGQSRVEHDIPDVALRRCHKR
ncbi:MAG: hypothetical protein ACREK4_02725 [Candidatus Rokuibacteriota bacterium]